MIKSNLLQKLAISSVFIVGGVSVALAQRVNASTIYGFSKLEWEARILLNMFPVPLDASTESMAEVVTDEGGGMAANNDLFNGDGFSDAIQSYVDNGGVQSPPVGGAPVAENTFNPRQGSFPIPGRPPGRVGPDFARGDAIACGEEICPDFWPGFLGSRIK